MKTLDEQKTYWVERLSRPSGGITLPLDRERPPVPSFLRETVSVSIGAEIYGRLKRDSNRPASQCVAPLAALTAAVYRYSGSTDIPIGFLIGSSNGNEQSNIVVLRTRLSPDESAQELLRQLRLSIEEAVANSECPFATVSEAVGRQGGAADEPLFHIAFRFSGSSSHGNRTPFAYADELARCDLVLHAREMDSGLAIDCEYDPELFDASTMERFLQHLAILLGEISANPNSQVAKLPLLTPDELQQLLRDWNNTKVAFARDACIHQLFEAQAERTPTQVAIVFEDEKLTYRELNARANQLAHRLRKLGVGPDALTGICVERSSEMMVGLLGILKAGGAYVPLDPNYPRDRLSFMVQDANIQVLLTQQQLLKALPAHSATVVCLNSFDSGLSKEPEDNLTNFGSALNLAYVIYTSGSTGRPKGVMVSHRNVVNFFAGMDRSIGGDGPGIWLAATSISFDISVLELFWTLCRGFTVVISRDQHRRADGSVAVDDAKKKKVDFSLLFFAADEGQDAGHRYRLLLEGAKFADEHDFEAVWTPERHFHAFGGLYPNPSVTSAAVAAITERIKIRAGSVVLPLQNPIRVAEEWSVVDNLSKGRVAISFATGWQINDFVLAPHNYSTRKEVMLRELETVRQLWRGETVQLPGVDGAQVPVKISPRPVQPELPIWITATGNPETCRTAGQLGANLLTHLVGQKIDDLAEKIKIYRDAWKESGHAGDGHVTLMLHTFVGEDLETVRETVREPFSNYLKTSADLLKTSPWGFAPARLPTEAQVKKLSAGPVDLTDGELSALLEHAFDRYFESSSLFGTPDVCLRMVEQIRGIGVDEIACLIDFGIDTQTVLGSLQLLNEVRKRSNESVGESTPNYSLATLARQHGATHFQCTPSLAGMLMVQPENREWIGRLRKMLIGGETFPPALARQLKESVRGSVHNLYGPTETTVYSATETVDEIEGAVSIGRPVANTEIYLLDQNFQLVPAGVTGELCISGLGVARGYLNRPELTSEKFIRNPFSADPESRLYRTGDLARYRRDGKIEFLGRMDDQVKVRGHRVELSEIAAVLGEHRSVRRAVVAAREDIPGKKRIVAYVVLRAGAPPEFKELRDYLAARLPEYMLPSAFVFLDRLPQTPNGKIDGRALPSPDAASNLHTDRFVAPRTPVEKLLAKIWAELLNINRVGAEDNFFELGGHSLMATQLIARLREIFSIELPLDVVFGAPTVSGLAAFIIAQERDAGATEKAALNLKRIDSKSEREVSAELQDPP